MLMLQPQQPHSMPFAAVHLWLQLWLGPDLASIVEFGMLTQS